MSRRTRVKDEWQEARRDGGEFDRIRSIAAELGDVVGQNALQKADAVVTRNIPKTKFDRVDRGDPRASVQELYGDHQGYMDKLAAAARAMETQGLLLAEDVAAILKEAEENSVLR